MMSEAAKIGPATIALVEAIMKAKPHPEQGFRSCLGIMQPGEELRAARLEAASRRGNDIGATTYGSIASILQERARQSLRQLESAGRPADPARQHPWPWLLPLTQSDASETPRVKTKGETMLTHPTHDRLIALGLTGMAKALEEQRKQPDIAALSFEERLALMVDREAIERENKRLVSRLKFASLRQIGRRRGCRHEGAARSRQGAVRQARRRRLDRRHQNLLDHAARPAPAKVGLPVRSATRRAATIAPSSIIACQGCSMPWRLHAATGVMHGSSRAWRASSC